MATARSSAQMLYGAAECRELDRLASEEHGMPGFELMQRAGRAACRILLHHWPEARRIAVCCGKGNNAGDGYVLAALARETGLDVTICQVGDPADLTGDAARARDWARARGLKVTAAPPEALHADVVVDALLGTGIQGELRRGFAETAQMINASGCPVLAIDLPSGVSADTGAAAEHAVRATVTVTFIGRKLGLFTGAGVSHAGRVVFEDLGVPGRVYRSVAGFPWLRYPDLGPDHRLGPRNPNVYKHALGHVVVVGGDHGMGGAPLMAAEAALRTGAGMVTVVTRAAHRSPILARCPELMVVEADDDGARRAVLEKAGVLVLGPGLGRGPWGQALLVETLAMGLPAVLDADGLNILAELDLEPKGPLVVTPHVAEAARLLEWEIQAVQNDRPGAAIALARRGRGTAVLKGPGTLLAGAGDGGDPALLGVCGHGNPGMASAGMGDVLSGIIGGFLAQGLPAPAAAVAGTCLHGYAGDRAAEIMGQRSLVATDLLAPLCAILREEELAWR